MAHEGNHFIDLSKSNITIPDSQHSVDYSYVKPRPNAQHKSQVIKEQIRAFIDRGITQYQPLFEVPRQNWQAINKEIYAMTLYHLFCLFFTDELMSIVVKYTNTAARKARVALSLTVIELRKRLGVRLDINFHGLVCQKDYWSCRYRGKGGKRGIAWRRFSCINRYLTFEHNKPPPNAP